LDKNKKTEVLDYNIDMKGYPESLKGYPTSKEWSTYISKRFVLFSYDLSSFVIVFSLPAIHTVIYSSSLFLIYLFFLIYSFTSFFLLDRLSIILTDNDELVKMKTVIGGESLPGDGRYFPGFYYFFIIIYVFLFIFKFFFLRSCYPSWH